MTPEQIKAKLDGLTTAVNCLQGGIDNLRAEVEKPKIDRAGQWFMDMNLGLYYHITETRDGIHWGPSNFETCGITCLLDEDNIADPAVVPIPPKFDAPEGFRHTGRIIVVEDNTPVIGSYWAIARNGQPLSRRSSLGA